MPALSPTASAGVPAPSTPARAARAWWPLAALVLLAAALRLPTLARQSFWYDEAFTAVHVFHRSLSATLSAMVHSENSPPLWYLIGWVDVRLFGDGAFALRLPSALAGIATVPIAWAIGCELSSRRAALIAAALVAVSPLFVWYSQEARVYSLFVFTSALAALCFLRALAVPSGGRFAMFAASGALALVTHYFSVFLLAPMVLWLLYRREQRRVAAAAACAIALVGLALIPLIAAQGGHGTQWIGRWALTSRLEAIPQYYLTGPSGGPLGHGVELLIALPLIAGAALGALALRTGGSPAADTHARRGAAIALVLLASGILSPLVLALAGADYLAPRNLVATMLPLTALLGVLLAAASSTRARRSMGPGADAVARADADAGANVLAPLSDGALVAMLLSGLAVIAFAVVCIDVDLSPRLQRGNWRGVARALQPVDAQTAIATVQLASAPLKYYLGGLRNLRRGGLATVSEIDEVGYKPLRSGAGAPPASGFHLVQRVDIDGLIIYRFRAGAPRRVSERTLRRAAITEARPEVLVAHGAQT
jgi:4-amino-4-deoxy-L-arabinose transferase-like glycosyltransferase